jgi:O-antigen/teichoic acid export membrane protein
VGLAVAFAAARAVGLVLHVVAARRAGARAAPGLVTREGLRAFAAGSVPIGAASLVLMALFRLDALMLAAFHDDVAVATYAAAYRLFETMLFAAQALRSSLFPAMSARGDGHSARRAVEKFTSATALAYVPFAVVCLVDAPQVLHLLYGDLYADASAGALRWLALAPLVWGLSYVSNGAAQALGRARVMLTGAIVATVFNVALNLAVIPRWAGTGAAAATTVSYAVLVTVVLAGLRPAMGGARVFRALAEPAVAAAVAATVLVVLRLPVLVEAAAACLAYLAVWWAIVRTTDPEQLAVLRSMR